MADCFGDEGRLGVGFGADKHAKVHHLGLGVEREILLDDLGRCARCDTDGLTASASPVDGLEEQWVMD